jgi:hypothetical protein
MAQAQLQNPLFSSQYSLSLMVLPGCDDVGQNRSLGRQSCGATSSPVFLVVHGSIRAEDRVG